MGGLGSLDWDSDEGMHIGRSFGGPRELELASEGCICDKADCGLVVFDIRSKCRNHKPATTTSRSGHLAKDCRGRNHYPAAR